MSLIERCATLTFGERVVLSVVAGLLNGMAFVFVGPLALIANAPLLAALHGTRTATRAALLGGVVGFLGGVHIYGILNYGALLFWAFSLYTASQMVVFALLWRALSGRLGAVFDVVLPALIWTVTEWIRTAGPLAMPASYVGCIADTAWLRPWLWLAPELGGLGVSTFIALFASAVFHGLVRPVTHGRAALGWAVVFLLGGGIGALMAPQLGERPVTVAGVQGGLANPQYKAAQADPSAMRDVVRTYETLSREAYDGGADLVVWPETAVRAPVLRVQELRDRLFPNKNDRSDLIAGLIHEASDGQRFNMAVSVRPGGETPDFYAKKRLVPNAEAHFTAGPEWRPLRTRVGLVGVMICLESVYPVSGRTLVKAGAELLVVMSNDAGFGRSPITRHMTNRAIVRAVENGRWLLRVGQAGVTTLIDPRGARHGQLDLFEAGVLTGTAALRDDQTRYTRWGDWWMLAVALVLLMSWLVAVFRGRAARR